MELVTNKNIGMKNLCKYLIPLFIIGLLMAPLGDSYAGNKDRSGQAGAGELLINPWARSSGWGNVNTANVRGVEGMFINVAGIAFTNKSEFGFSYVNYLKGTGINVFTFGYTQKLGESSVLGVSVFSMTFGSIEVTTSDNPDGGIGEYSPAYLNVNLAYGKAFSNSIYGGLNIKIVSEAIADVSAQGIAIDAGIQYVTGARDQVMFGIALKNVGPRMKYSGDGLLQKAVPNLTGYTMSTYMPASTFELPAALDIGAAYNFDIGEITRLTLAANFRSNSFGKDQFIGGLEIALKEILMLRAGYTYEDGITQKEDRTTVYTGPSAGVTVNVPLNKEKGSSFGVDYSYRATDPFTGIHSVGIILAF
jgi:hypothetical protein